jgi:hypothetical protein
MRNLAEITVDIQYFDDPRAADVEHAEITVSAPGVTDDMQAFGYPTLTEVAAGANYVAGILGRLAFVFTNDIQLQRIEHGCLQHLTEVDVEYGTGCSISGSFETMLDPSVDTGDAPAIWINVPVEKGQEWLEKVHSHLQAITAALAWGRPR